MVVVVAKTVMVVGTVLVVMVAVLKTAELFSHLLTARK
jgi:hypothetical protein